MVEKSLLVFSRYAVDRDNEQLWLDNQPIRLTNKALAVLCYLVEHPGQLVTKDALFASVWSETVVSETTLTNCIGEVRRALGDDPKQPRFIETVQRRGYRFIEKVGSRESKEQRAESTEQRATLNGSSSARSPQPPAPFLVGREPELAQLDSLFTKAINGRRQMVFVTGEAGIGKTALVESFWQRLEDEGRRLAFSSQASSLQSPTSPVSKAHGQCVEQYGAGEAYMPVLEALGHLGRGPQKARVLTV